MGIKHSLAAGVLTILACAASAGTTFLFVGPRGHVFLSDQPPPPPQVLIQQPSNPGQGFWRKVYIDQFNQSCNMAPTVYGQHARCMYTNNLIVGERLEFVPY